MKKYKLIKTYPGSPPIGTIAERYQNLSIKFTNTLGDIWHSSDHPELIENHPEYWQEVVEKEYEILAFKDSFNCLLIKESNFFRRGNPWSSNHLTLTLVGCLGRFSIHSIKRLSDGEVFTVGDKITFNINNVKGSAGTISDIELYGSTLVFKDSKQNYTASLKIVGNKLKKPLFKTFDGVDIYENEKFTSVDKNSMTIHSARKLAEKGKTLRKDLFYFFSSIEIANEFINLNKQNLSVRDVIDAIDKYQGIKEWVLDELKGLVKSRL